MLSDPIKVILLSLWLPVLVAAVSVLWSGGARLGESVTNPMEAVLFFALGWPFAIPSTLAVFLLHRHSRIAAYLCGVVLVPLSVLAWIGTGVLGPGIFICAAILPVPAWVVLLVARLRGKGRLT